MATVLTLCLLARPSSPPAGPAGSQGDGLVSPAADHAPMPTTCGPGGEQCGEELVGTGGWRLRVFRNFPMSGSASVARAVIVIHGTGRNARGYFASMMRAAAGAGVRDQTLVLAPWFRTAEDSPGQGEAVWTKDAWKVGQAAQTPRGLSSFAVMDELVATLASKQRFPNLRRITIAGHSAGGQFAQRYAALGLAPNGLPGVEITYVVANPSSYLYFDPRRPTSNGFEVPAGSCADYDSYKYGLRGRSGYTARLAAEQVLANYAHRAVTVINGAEDTVDNGDLDSDCGAMAQGANRAVRGANYLRYVRSVAPGAAQSRIVVPGVDHDGEAIFTSSLSRPALFGTGTGTAGTGRAR